MEPLLSIRPSLHGRVCEVADGGDEVRAAPLPRVHAHEVRHDLLQTHGDPQQELLHMLTDRSGLLEVGAGAVVGLNEALPAVEERHHEHAQGEEVAGHAAHRFVLRLGGCERREEKGERCEGEFNAAWKHPGTESFNKACPRLRELSPQSVLDM